MRNCSLSNRVRVSSSLGQEPPERYLRQLQGVYHVERFGSDVHGREANAVGIESIARWEHEHFMRNSPLDGLPHWNGSSLTGQNDVADNPRCSLFNISSLVLSVNNHLSKYDELHPHKGVPGMGDRKRRRMRGGSEG